MGSKLMSSTYNENVWESSIFSWVSPGGPALAEVAPCSHQADCSSTMSSVRRLGHLFKLLFKKKKKRGRGENTSIHFHKLLNMNLTSSHWRSAEIARANWWDTEAVVGLQRAEQLLFWSPWWAKWGALQVGAATLIQMDLSQEGHLELC